MKQISFDDLFKNEKSNNDPSSSQLPEQIIKLLESGITSVLEMCESLINEGYISKERFSSTDKPKDYPKVCLILDEMVQQGKVELIEDMDKTNRIYRLK
ncbi:DUF3895 domain-containing protein [Ferdinandcohnia sp. SAFN-114]|uniref:DUF3895 domain-containing protein n=1 Tax=Ferdinandcohnia sp. SAFN-114 TaxID=3387275 RepID=UPI003F81FA06